MSSGMRKIGYITLSILVFIIALYALSSIILSNVGGFLIIDENPVKSNAVVVLSTGVEYYPRLIEAANLYNRGLAGEVVINGNRKTDELREIEKKGYVACCAWQENSLRILSIYGVPRDKVICISAEDAYETISEAQIVGEKILQKGYSRIILTTSKSHTRRASFIWKRMYGDRLSVYTVTAKADPYDPESWWRDGRQIRWVLAEYGAWIYYCWKSLKRG